MQEHYNAFISYRHAELDSKIAEHVQRSLEHFGIPGKIKKKYNINKIERVFRDKDELPITANLNDTIQNALINADYLIVICSPSTRESIWVQREIEFFLSTHSRDKVLTVLADGEPFEVIPEILLKEERTVTDDNGNEVKITVDLEPLSCDYRMGTRKADKEELPRLASCLIGCSYDELMDRRRQYRARRAAIIVAAVFVALIAFGSYIFYSMTQVQKSLHQAQISNSQYLAGESRRLLDNQERNKAIQLALLALPGVGRDIPLIPEAQRVLTDAVYAYVNENDAEMGVEWNYTMPTNVKFITISSDARFLVAVDTANNASMWNTETKALLFTVPHCADDITKAYIIDSSNILLLSSEKCLYAFNLPDGTKAWELEAPVDYTGDPCISKDGKTIFVPEYYQGFMEIETNTGTIKATYNPNFGYEYGSIHGEYLSPNEKKLITFVMFDYSSYLNKAICLYNIDTGEYQVIAEEEAYEYSATWIDDSTVIIQLTDNDSTIDLGEGDATYCTATLKSICVNADTCEILWTNELTYTDIEGRNHGTYVPANNSFVAFGGSRYEMYDVASGEVINAFNVSSSILKVGVSSNNDYAYYFASDGTYGTALSNSTFGEFMQFHYSDNRIADVTSNNGIYCVNEGSNSIIQLSYTLYDDNWNHAGGTTIDEYVFNSDKVYMNDKFGAVVADYIETLYIIDPAGNKVSQTYDLTDPESDGLFRHFSILGSYDDKLYLGATEVTCNQIIEVNIDSNRIRTLLTTGDTFVNYTSTMADHYTLSANGFGDDAELILLNLDDNSRTSIPLESYPEERNLIASYLPSAGLVHYINATGEDIFYDVDEEDEVSFDIPDDWRGTQTITCSPNGKVFMADSTRVAVFSSDGDLESEFDVNLGQVKNIFFYREENANEDTIFIILNTGYLCRYTSSYQFMGNSKLTVSQDPDSIVTVSIDSRSDCMYIRDDNIMNIVEMDNWYEVASINNAIGHYSPDDRIFTYSNSPLGLQVGYYNHYTIEQLEQMGTEVIGNYEMTAEERAEYGL